MPYKQDQPWKQLYKLVIHFAKFSQISIGVYVVKHRTYIYFVNFFALYCIHVVICRLVFVLPSVPLITSIVERSVIQYENLIPQWKLNPTIKCTMWGHKLHCTLCSIVHVLWTVAASQPTKHSKCDTIIILFDYCDTLILW